MEAAQQIILTLIRNGGRGGMRVGELQKETSISRTAVSHHLRGRSTTPIHSILYSVAQALGEGLHKLLLYTLHHLYALRLPLPPAREKTKCSATLRRGAKDEERLLRTQEK